MNIILVACARPNFMKIAPLYREMKKSRLFNPIIIHTGQHYDHNMSQVFFDDLNIPKPAISLGVGSGSHAKQTASNRKITTNKVTMPYVFASTVSSLGLLKYLEGIDGINRIP